MVGSSSQGRTNKSSVASPASLASSSSPGFPIFLMLFCTLFSAAGQLFLKLGAKGLDFSIQGTILNFTLVAGCLLYFVGAALLVLSLKRAELSVTYPLVSLSFIWVSLLSIFFLGETLALWDWAGIVLIIAGISLIGRGA